MPSRRKSLMFASASFVSVCSFVIVCLVLATRNWVSSKINYSERNSTVAVSISYGLFQGVCFKTAQAGLGKEETPFQVFDNLEHAKLRSFNVVIIVLLVISLLSSLLSSIFTGLNALSNPYQTFLGPIGVYTWNSICGISSLLTLILFPVNVEANKLSTELAIKPCMSSRQSKQSSTYGYSYWIILLIVLCNAATIIIIVFYQQARYSERKERERTIESAPKDGILF
ncbi:clarin-3 [Tiliqua scincoides]|uniref:clarin-3 n=1 Tax=Tiliqua scincoides TaxID=71010 RepID=UPI003461E2FA